MTTISVSHDAVEDITCDALVVIATPSDTAPDSLPALVPADSLPAEMAAHVADRMEALGFTAAEESVVTMAAVPGLAARRLVVVGIGSADAATDGPAVQRAVGAAVRGISKAAHVGVVSPAAATAGDAAAGALLGAYRFTAHKGTRTTDTTLVEQVTLVATDDVAQAVERADAVAGEVMWARDLVNTPPNVLYPQTFAEAVARRAEGVEHLTVDVLDDEALLAGGYGGIMGVGQGSSHLPRLVTLTYAPPEARAHLALVGKGITFDSGGLDIKPADGMWAMKSDMAGAAAVAAAAVAAARLALPVKVTAVLGLAENMPSGTAQRASDVVTMHDGTTVEITNTDAEGRMVLADAMLHAAKAEPDHLVDIATLTGHQIVALGTEIAAVMGNDDDFRALVVDAATSVGEQTWPMPLPKAIRKELESDVADLRHKGGRPGGMLAAGLFLAEFVPGEGDDRTPWAHVDIAGPSFNEGAPKGFTPKGGTGFGVTTLLAVAERLAQRD